MREPNSTDVLIQQIVTGSEVNAFFIRSSSKVRKSLNFNRIYTLPVRASFVSQG